MHHYPFHLGDYLKATAHLGPMEDICYRRLLDLYYDTEQPIPVETQSVSRRLRLDSELVANVLREFFVCTERGWENTRCEAEIAAYNRRCESNRLNGKAGGRPKKTQSVTSGLPNESQNNLNHKPQTTNHKPSKPNAAPAARFDPLAMVLPECIPRLAWEEWIAYRRGRRVSTTEQTARGQINKLAEWHAKGHSPRLIIEDSIANGWQGLFEPKNGVSNGKDRQSVIAAFTGVVRRGGGSAIPGEFERVD